MIRCVTHDDDFTLLKALERKHHPPHRWMMQDFSTMEDVREYAESSVVEAYICRDRSYVIVSRREVIDLAIAHPADVFPLLRCVAKWVARNRLRKLEMDCVPASLRLLRTLARRYGCEIVEGEQWDWDGDTMQEVTVYIPRRRRRHCK